MDLAIETNQEIIRRELVRLLSGSFYSPSRTAMETIRDQLKSSLSYLIELSIHHLNNGIEIVSTPARDPRFKGKIQHVIIFYVEDEINHNVRMKFQFITGNPKKIMVRVVTAKLHY